MHSHKLLTIAIPTFNRAGYLGVCLESVFSGLPDGDRQHLEVLVFDNASTDDTEQVVSEARRRHPDIHYVRHPENRGADQNMRACYEGASAKYVQILGDDDLWIPGRLPQLLGLLKTGGDYGAIHMKCATYQDSPEEAFLKKSTPRYQVYEDSNQFLYRVGLMATFISACVFNKDLVKDNVAPEKSVGTHFAQLAWYIPAALRGRPNLFVEQRMLACKRDNSGGYRLFHVFGENLVGLFEAFRAEGLSPLVVDKLRLDLQYNFFPAHLNRLQTTGLAAFDTDDLLNDLDRVFRNDRFYRLTLRPLAANRGAEGIGRKLARRSIGRLRLRVLNCRRGRERVRRGCFP
jgi:abequosyltransferase